MSANNRLFYHLSKHHYNIFSANGIIFLSIFCYHTPIKEPPEIENLSQLFFEDDPFLKTAYVSVSKKCHLGKSQGGCTVGHVGSQTIPL